MTILDTSSHINENQESLYLEIYDQDSISPQNFELDQYQLIDKFASFHFNEIELEDEYNADQYCNLLPLFESMLTLFFLPDLDPIPKPTLIPIPIKHEPKPPILDSHIPMLENECELEFYDLDQIHDPTPTLEPKLDLSFILELVLVPIPFIVEPKSSIPQNRIPLLDRDLDQYDSVMVSQDWSYNQKKFHARISQDPIHIGEYKNTNRKEVIKVSSIKIDNF